MNCHPTSRGARREANHPFLRRHPTNGRPSYRDWASRRPRHRHEVSHRRTSDGVRRGVNRPT